MPEGSEGSNGTAALGVLRTKVGTDEARGREGIGGGEVLGASVDDRDTATADFRSDEARPRSWSRAAAISRMSTKPELSEPSLFPLTPMLTTFGFR